MRTTAGEASSIWFAVAVFCVVGLTQVFVYVVVRRITLDADFQQFMKAEASLKLIRRSARCFPMRRSRKP